MKLRIVECIFPDSGTYYITQRKVLGLFWVTFNWDITYTDKVPMDYKSYDEALNAIKVKLQNIVKKQRNYYYISHKELSTDA